MTAMAVDTSRRDIRKELVLRPIINASGTMTVLGASIMVPQAVALDPPVMARDYQTDLGHIDLDACNLHPGEEQVVARQLVACPQTLGEQHVLVRVSRVCLNKSVLQTFLWVGSTLSRTTAARVPPP